MTPKEFEELANVYRSRLVRSAVYKWGADGEDAIQEAFLRAYENIDKYDHSYTFTTWIFKIAKNIIIDWKRKDNITIDGDVDVLDLPDCVTPELITSGRQFIDMLEELPPLQFHAIIDKMDGVAPNNRENLRLARKKIYENTGHKNS